ncbi:hypothetical protein D1AOALGA4SA_10129 [Olavius algarvensis Delta 1 endosymbiont]|nr:hypothetical protein D1AOALGA4SA_10129 [Olavius algarvensis Delta 1 endosymbiont]
MTDCLCPTHRTIFLRFAHHYQLPQKTEFRKRYPNPDKPEIATKPRRHKEKKLKKTSYLGVLAAKIFHLINPSQPRCDFDK